MKTVLASLLLLIATPSFAYCTLEDQVCQQNEALIRAQQDQAQAMMNIQRDQAAEQQRQQLEQNRSQNHSQWIN